MDNRATRIELFSFRSVQMRVFHLAWMAFFMCFFAWFAVAPLMPMIRDDLGLTKDQIANINIAAVLRHHFRAPAHRAPLRSLRCAPYLHSAARFRRHPGHRDRLRAKLSSVPVLPAMHRRDRRVVRHHAVPHVRHVRAERRRHGERNGRGLGQRGRRRDASRSCRCCLLRCCPSASNASLGWRLALFVPGHADAASWPRCTTDTPRTRPWQSQ